MQKSGTTPRERTCPVCRRKFLGRLAMRQHMSTHAQRPAPAQPRRARNRRGGQGQVQGRLETGTDVIGVLTLKAPGQVGTLLLDLAVDPRKFMETRFRQVSQLWGKWRPRSLKFSIIPSAGANVNGKYTVAWTANATEMLLQGEALVRQCATFAVSREAHVYDRVEMQIPCAANGPWYNFGSKDPSMLEHGTFLAVLSAPLAAVTGDFVFTVHLNWSVEFRDPQMGHFGVADAIFSDPGWSPYFTDSYSGWQNGERLTLKAHTGGAPVLFSDARRDVLYEFKGKSLSYVKSGGTGEIKYGVIARDYTAGNIMAVFQLKMSAETYLATGDASNIEKYVGAGGYSVPESPPWVPLSEVQALLSNRNPKPDSLRVEDRYEQLERRLADLELSRMRSSERSRKQSVVKASPSAESASSRRLGNSGE